MVVSQNNISQLVLVLTRYSIKDLYAQFGYQVINSCPSGQIEFVDTLLRENSLAKDTLTSFGESTFNKISKSLFIILNHAAKKHGHIGNIDHLIEILFEENSEKLRAICQNLGFQSFNKIGIIPALVIAERFAGQWMNLNEEGLSRDE